MAKDDKKDIKQDEMPVENVPTVQENTGTDNTPPETGGEESGKEELQVPTQQGNSKKQDDKKNPKVDSTGKGKSNEKKGDNAEGGQVKPKTDNPNPPKEDPKPNPLTGTKTTAEKCEKIAKDVFAKHTNCKVLHFTADLIPFFDLNDAVKHGVGKLKDDTIVTIKRK